MNARPLRILQVNQSDLKGGAQKVSWTLFKGYQALGHQAWVAVGRKESDDANVFVIPNERHPKPWAPFADSLYEKSLPWARNSRKLRTLRKWSYAASQGRAVFDRTLGWEDFDFPASRQVLELPPQKPDILHLHNLHGSYFDLRALPNLSHRVPTLITMHDTWLLTGHCAHPFNCTRWETGCGLCPDLTIAPAIPRDLTDYNWKRKQKIYAASNLYIATPSRALMDKLERSILNGGAREKRVIPYGIDLETFSPGDKRAARQALSLEPDIPMVLFTAHGIRYNPWKDWQTVKQVAEMLASRNPDRKLVILNLGESWKSEWFGPVEIRSVGFFTDPEIIRTYYRAADTFIHPALTDTFPNVILETMACGLAPIATAVGGIPEQIVDGVTGYLVPPRDPEAFVQHIQEMLQDPDKRERMGRAGVERARTKYDLHRQVRDYLDWYNEILAAQSPSLN